jgi:hypothetical protein
MFFRRAAMTLTAVLVWSGFAAAVASADTVSGYWDNVAVDYIQQTNAGPAIAARMLAIMHTAMYDAWTAYDPIAVPSRANGILKRPPEETTDSNKIEAISFAAHKALVDLLPSMASGVDIALNRLGYDLEDVGSADTSTPAGIGNVAAEAVIEIRQYGGASPTPYLAVRTPDPSDDPNAWRPLRKDDGSRVVQRDSADSWNQ